MKYNKTSELAREFSKVLAEWLTPEQMRDCVEKNGTPEYQIGEACPTHDYCDANMAMAEAFKRVYGCEPDGSSDAINLEWNEAWKIARINNYQV